MLDAKTKELLAKGYPPGIVSKAMQWAVGSATGNAKYGLDKKYADENDAEVNKVADLFLPTFLRESEKWIRAFGHEPKTDSPPR